MKVGAGLELAIDFVENAVDAVGFDSLGPVADAEEGDAHALLRPVSGQAHHRVVAVPARELPEGGRVARLGQRELGRDEQLSLLQRRGVEALEEVLGGDAALAFFSGDDEGRSKRDRAGGQLGGRIGEGAAPAEGAAVADRRVRDMRHRGRDERKVFGYVG